jgi:hypothetical protein
MEQAPSWEANSSSDIEQTPQIYATPRFITTFTTANHLSLS